MKRILLLLGIFMLASVLFACAPKVELATPVTEKPVEVDLPMEKKGWEAEWEKTLSEARKEGQLIVWTSTLTPKLIAEIFEKKYDIKMAVLSNGGAAFAAKLMAERLAGIYSVDLYIGGGNPIVAYMKPKGVLSHLPPFFILPEVKDEKAWYEGKHPFIDKEAMIFAMAAYPQHPLNINTEVMSKEEVNSYYDLLNPKWKKKIISEDFTTPRGGLKWFSAMVEKNHGPILGIDYMKQLAAQEPIILRDDRLALEWLMRGRYPMALNKGMDVLIENLRREGIYPPILGVTPKEGGYITTGAGFVTLVDRAPHPNAARVFINWLLSRDAQIEYSKISLKQSTRIDIPPAKEINPRMLAREPGIRFVNADTEEYLLKTDEYLKMATEIFGHLVK